MRQPGTPWVNPSSNALTETGIVPERVDTDKAKCYPPALRAVLPTVKHRRSNYVHHGRERDHQHLKQRIYSMRGFKNAVAADTLCCGHALIQNLRNGFSRLTAAVPRALRLMTAWSLLTQAI